MSKITAPYTWIEDPGHSWLCVPKKEVVESGADISVYSYQDPETGMAYLEEDCDACIFLAAAGKLKDENGNYTKFPSIYQQDTFVRYLPSYKK